MPVFISQKFNISKIEQKISILIFKFKIFNKPYSRHHNHHHIMNFIKQMNFSLTLILSSLISFSVVLVLDKYKSENEKTNFPIIMTINNGLKKVPENDISQISSIFVKNYMKNIKNQKSMGLGKTSKFELIEKSIILLTPPPPKEKTH